MEYQDKGIQRQTRPWYDDAVDGLKAVPSILSGSIVGPLAV